MADEARAFVPRIETLALSINDKPRRSQARLDVAKGMRLLRAITNGGDNGAFAQRSYGTDSAVSTAVVVVRSALAFDTIGTNEIVANKISIFFKKIFSFERTNTAPVEPPVFSVGHAVNDDAVTPELVERRVCFKVTQYNSVFL